MSEPTVSQPVTAARKSQHDHPRLNHWTEKPSMEKEDPKRKVKIITGFVAAGTLLWAWMAMH